MLEKLMGAKMEFLGSLGVIGYVLIALVILCLWNLRRIIFLKSPLDSQQHKNWRQMGVDMDDPDHLDRP